MPPANPRIIALFDVDGTLTPARKVRSIRLALSVRLCACLPAHMRLRIDRTIEQSNGQTMFA